MARSKAADERKLYEECQSQLEASDREMSKIRDDAFCSWDEKEAMLLGRNKDGISKTTKSQIYDPRLSTIVLERAARVMSQFPSGKVKASDKSDVGKNMLMNLLLERHVQPNANSQYDLLTKFMMLDLYSLVYGSMCALIDWRVSDEYIGPDLWLIPVRNLYPQAGTTTIESASFTQVATSVELGWLKNRPSSKWMNIDKLVAEIERKKGGKSRNNDPEDRKSFNESLYLEDNAEKGDRAKVELVTRYEKDRWVTYARDYEYILRDIDNPQDNGRIPIIKKDCWPLLDRFWGMSEFERGKTLQYATNSLINMYMDSVAYSLYPVRIINPNGVVESSIQPGPGALWLETIPNSIRTEPTNNSGLSTFQSTYSFLVAAMQNQAGSAGDNSVARESDPTQGKTPQALKMMENRMGSRDHWDKRMMEQTVESAYNLFVDLLSKRQDKPIDLDVYESEIEKISELYPDVTEAFESGSGKITIKKDMLSGTKYKYYVDPGSTVKRDEQQEVDTLTNMMTLVTKIPQIQEALMQTGKQVDIGEMFKRILISAGTQDWDKLITDMPQMQAGMDGGMGGMPGQQMPQQQLPPLNSQDPQVQALYQQIAGAFPNG